MAKGTSIPRLNELYNRAPSGALSADDLAFADRALSRTLEGVTAGTAEATRDARRRYGARGIGGPALEQTLADVTQAGEAGRVKAGESYQDLLHNIRLGNKSLEQQRNLFAWGSEIDASKAKTAQHYAQRAGFWNSIISLAPNLITAGAGVPKIGGGGVGGVSPGGGGGFAGPNPTVPQMPNF